MIHKISDVLEVAETLPAVSRTAATVTGAKIYDLTQYEGGLQLSVSAGTVGGGGTLDVKWQESDNSDMSSASDVTGSAFTQITAASFQQKDLRVRQFTKRYARPSFTVAVAAIVYSATVVAQKRVQ